MDLSPERVRAVWFATQLLAFLPPLAAAVLGTSLRVRIASVTAFVVIGLAGTVFLRYFDRSDWARRASFPLIFFLGVGGSMALLDEKSLGPRLRWNP